MAAVEAVEAVEAVLETKAQKADVVVEISRLVFLIAAADRLRPRRSTDLRRIVQRSYVLVVH